MLSEETYHLAFFNQPANLCYTETCKSLQASLGQYFHQILSVQNLETFPKDELRSWKLIARNALTRPPFPLLRRVMLIILSGFNDLDDFINLFQLQNFGFNVSISSRFRV